MQSSRSCADGLWRRTSLGMLPSRGLTCASPWNGAGEVDGYSRYPKSQ